MRSLFIVSILIVLVAAAAPSLFERYKPIGPAVLRADAPSTTSLHMRQVEIAAEQVMTVAEDRVGSFLAAHPRLVD